jgi:hypothetical protein
VHTLDALQGAPIELKSWNGKRKFFGALGAISSPGVGDVVVVGVVVDVRDVAGQARRIVRQPARTGEVANLLHAALGRSREVIPGVALVGVGQALAVEHPARGGVDDVRVHLVARR